MTSNSTVVSISARLLMANRSYGRVRKKSNHAAAETAARIPASRYPLAATATTTRIRARAASVLGKLPRNGTRSAASASGATSPASTARVSRRGIRDVCMFR